MKNETARREFLGTGLGAALGLLASQGLSVTEVRAQGNGLVTIVGLTSDGSDEFYSPHLHGFEATLDLLTGELSGFTTSTIPTGKEPVRPHPHAIAVTADPFDFDAVVETSPTPVHTHLVRPN